MRKKPDIKDVELTFKQYYQTDPELKRSGVAIEWTQEMIDEMRYCAKNPLYFITNYIYIRTLDSGSVLFDPYPYQKEMIEAFHAKRFIICNCPRQSGKTTVVVAYLLWYLLFNPYKLVGVLANKQSGSKNILRRIKHGYKKLPKWLQPGVLNWTELEFSLENGSSIFASPTSVSSARGESCNLLYVDEVAHIMPTVWDEFYKSTYPTVSSGKTSKMIMTSTPKGMNHFREIWVKALQKRNTFYPIEVLWNDIPGRDEEWKAQEIANTSLEIFEQEYCGTFLGASDCLFDLRKLDSLIDIDPLGCSNEVFKIYKLPEEFHTYVAIVDSSEGKGKDSSVINVIDITNEIHEQVAVYKNNEIGVLEFPEIIYSLATHYNQAYVLIEINSIGTAVCNDLFYELDYENVLYTGKETGGKEVILSFGNADNSEIGIRTTKTVKKQGCKNIKAIVENYKIIINDKETIREMQTFVKKGKSGDSFGADNENRDHDDIVMTLVLYAWMVKQQAFINEMSQNIGKVISNKFKEENEGHIPLGFISNGEDMLTADSNGFFNDAYDDCFF